MLKLFTLLQPLVTQPERCARCSVVPGLAYTGWTLKTDAATFVPYWVHPICTAAGVADTSRSATLTAEPRHTTYQAGLILASGRSGSIAAGLRWSTCLGLYL
jgi:hypothetical protein